MTTALRGALIGFGFIGERGHLPAYSQPGRAQLAITAVADVCEARRQAARRILPHAAIYEDARSMLAAEGDRLDFVNICTPPCDHASLAHQALARGLHVLCEKPLATSEHDARSMLEHARDARRVLYPGHNYKHAPVVRKVREIVESGRIGEVRLLTLDTFRNTHARGVPEWEPDWRRMRRFSGGGIAMDHGSHTFYLAFEWLRAFPSAITAKMSHLAAFDTEDNFSCTLTFPTGLAVCQLTWNAGMRRVIYTLHGERGAIKVEDDVVEVVVNGVSERCEIPSHWMDASHVHWYRSLLDDFGRAVAEGDHVGREAHEAYMCIKLIESAYASARSGSREVSLLSDVVQASAGGAR